MSSLMDEYLSQDREWGVVTRFDKTKGYGFIKSKRTERHTSSISHSVEVDAQNTDIW